jgi:hypothetical protein
MGERHGELKPASCGPAGKVLPADAYDQGCEEDGMRHMGIVGAMALGITLGGACSEPDGGPALDGGDSGSDASSDAQAQDAGDVMCAYDAGNAGCACDNGNPCDGEETCVTLGGSCWTCAVGTPPADEDQLACQWTESTQGVCRLGACGPAGCGDGNIDVDEECEGAFFGCNQATCQWICESDGECDDGETCDVGAHTCEAP